MGGSTGLGLLEMESGVEGRDGRSQESREEPGLREMGGRITPPLGEPDRLEIGARLMPLLGDRRPASYDRGFT